MNKVNVQEIKERIQKSPKGKFGCITKDISVALGSDDESLDLSKRHAFELSLVRIPPGRSKCPYHSHSTSSEFYLVISGRGSIRDKDGLTAVGAGDAFFFAPGEAHQLTNAGEEDFVYYVIADSPRSDSCFYPDSGKFNVSKADGNWVIVKGQEPIISTARNEVEIRIQRPPVTSCPPPGSARSAPPSRMPLRYWYQSQHQRRSGPAPT